jgi:nucleoside-diphosphate-sugar epimerase
MRILIIGGTRFTGPETVRLLLEHGHQVTVFHRGLHRDPRTSGAAEILGDLKDLKQFRDRFLDLKPDVVVNMLCFTAQAASEFVSLVQGNTGRVVVISSADVYLAFGRLHRTEPGPILPMPLKETSALRTTDLPGGPEYDKISVESSILGNPELRGTILRFPAVYGPHDPQHRLHAYLKRFDDRRPAILLAEGVARWRWSRGYADNVGLATALAVMDDRSTGEIYNVAEPTAFAEADWIRRIGQAAGWQGEVVTVPREQLPGRLGFEIDPDQHYVLDTSKIRDELGYREQIPQEEALARTIAWERANPPEKIDPDDFDYAAEDRVLENLRNQLL